MTPLPLDTTLAAHDPTQLVLPEPHEPLVTVSIEEQALAPPLARIPYWEHLLELVRQDLPLAAYLAAMDPALARAHADLVMAQLQYMTDVAANMPADTHTTASRIFRLAWRDACTSHATVVRLRTVYMYLYFPQSVAASHLTPPRCLPLCQRCSRLKTRALPSSFGTLEI